MNKERYLLTFTKMILPLVPAMLRRRVAGKLYNNKLKKIKGIDIVVDQPGYKLLVNTKDTIGWNVFFFGEYESTTNNILKKYIRPGDTVIEAGANIGTETILLANLVGDTGRIFAFEPVSHVFKRLQHNVVVLNKKLNISCFDYALGETTGPVTFHIYPDNFHNSGLGSKYHIGKGKPVTVQQDTLDNLFSQGLFTKVDFIKMDVQSSEPDILTGAAEVIRRFRPHIFLEARENHGRLYELLTGAGYGIYMITISGLEPVKQRSATITDWLAIHKHNTVSQPDMDNT